MTCRFLTRVPEASASTPEPNPRGVEIVTTAALALLNTSPGVRATGRDPGDRCATSKTSADKQTRIDATALDARPKEFIVATEGHSIDNRPAPICPSLSPPRSFATACCSAHRAHHTQAA